MSDKWCYDLVVDGRAMKLPRVTWRLMRRLNAEALGDTPEGLMCLSA